MLSSLKPSLRPDATAAAATTTSTTIKSGDSGRDSATKFIAAENRRIDPKDRFQMSTLTSTSNVVLMAFSNVV
jgi:hypothetical protein